MVKVTFFSLQGLCFTSTFADVSYTHLMTLIPLLRKEEAKGPLYYLFIEGLRLHFFTYTVNLKQNKINMYLCTLGCILYFPYFVIFNR